MRSAKLFCQESLSSSSVKTLEIKNIGDCDALNVRMVLPKEIMLWDYDGLFPFPKLEAGRKIRLQYCHNPMLDGVPAYVEIIFLYTDEEGEKEFKFYLTT